MNAAEWNEEAARGRESGVGEIELAIGNGKISIGDGFSEEKAIGDTSLPSHKYVSKLQVEIARGEVIERELAFAAASLCSVAFKGETVVWTSSIAPIAS